MQINSHFITIDNSGNIIIAMKLGTMGYFYNNMYASTIAIIKYDSSENLLWQRSFLVRVLTPLELQQSLE